MKKTENRISIPKISSEELMKRYQKIKPIVKIDNMYYFLKTFDEYDLKNVSYIWNSNADKNLSLNETQLEILGEFSCYHTYKYCNLFKPSIEEILSQYPIDMIDNSNAFYMYERPEDLEDFYHQWDIIEKGYHKSKIRALRIK